MDDILKLRHFTDDIGKADLVIQLEQVMNIRSSEVAVQKQHLALHLGEGYRKVGGNGTFSFTL